MVAVAAITTASIPPHELARRLMSISSGRQQLLEELRRGGADIREVQRPADLEGLTDEGAVDLPAHRSATHRGRQLAMELGALDVEQQFSSSDGFPNGGEPGFEYQEPVARHLQALAQRDRGGVGGHQQDVLIHRRKRVEYR